MVSRACISTTAPPGHRCDAKKRKNARRIDCDRAKLVDSLGAGKTFRTDNHGEVKACARRLVRTASREGPLDPVLLDPPFTKSGNLQPFTSQVRAGVRENGRPVINSQRHLDVMAAAARG